MPNITTSKIHLFVWIAFVFSLISACTTTSKTKKIDEAKVSKEIDIEFPEDVLGYWKGELEIFRDTGLVQQIPMAILIEETLDNEMYIWEITYNPGKEEDKRPYLLIVKNKERGHYQVDEDNGIILDAFLLDNKLFSTFEVGKSMLTTVNTFIGDEMVFEVIAGSADPINTTGDMKVGEHSIPPVYSFSTATYQRAILKRIRG